MGRSSSQEPSPLPLSLERRGIIRRRLLAWYDKYKRDLPWRRRANDAYAQWVAEIMLQQTRVETVLAYYERFLRRFPDVHALARADHDDVLKSWEGLGYYRRALHLHEAAKTLARRNESVPISTERLRELPGVGEYTAAAIASIAFGTPVAAVDGNVIRVLSRLFALPMSASVGRQRVQVQLLAQALVSRRRPGDFNQAWMDLGSAVCVPGTPCCDACPLQAMCETAQGSSRGKRVRPRGQAAPNPVVNVLVGVFRIGDRILVRRRPRGALWSGLWEFPTAVLDDSKSAAAEIRALARIEGLRLSNSAHPTAVLRHDLTHRRMMFQVFAGEAESVRKGLYTPSRKARSNGGEPAPIRKVTPRPHATGPDGQPRAWVTTAEFAELPVSTAHRKIHALAHATR